MTTPLSAAPAKESNTKRTKDTKFRAFGTGRRQPAIAFDWRCAPQARAGPFVSFVRFVFKVLP